MAEPLNVECPDCTAPAGTPCYTSVSALAGSTHAERQRIADLRALEHGTCALCGGPMVRGSVEGSPVDAWHADAAFAAACPPLPDPRTHYNAWAEAQNLGLTAGHPGAEHFIPDPPRPVTELPPLGEVVGICPECAAEKHINCVGEALNPVTDEIGPCGCKEAGHA